MTPATTWASRRKRTQRSSCIRTRTARWKRSRRKVRVAWSFKFRFIFYFRNFYGIVKKKKLFALSECKSSLQLFKSALNSFHALVNFDFWKKNPFFPHLCGWKINFRRPRLIACAEMFDEGQHFDSPLDGYRSERHKFNLVFRFCSFAGAFDVC